MTSKHGMVEASRVPDSDDLAEALRRLITDQGADLLSGPVGTLLGRSGFTGFAFLLQWRGVDGVVSAPGLSGGALAPVGAAYVAAGLLPGDPFMRHVYEAAVPVFWTPYLTRAVARGDGRIAARVSDLLRENGITAGVTIPIVCDGSALRGAFSVSGAPGSAPEAFAEAFRREGWVANLVGTVLLARASRLLPVPQSVVLTGSERLALYGLARGRRPAEIAAAAGKSGHTVRHQIASAVAKLGAKTQTEAVARAVAAGIIRL